MRNCDTMNAISENIQDLLRLHGMTQVDLAAKTQMKQPAISRLLTDENANPTISTLEAIAEAFSVEVSDIVRKKRKKVAC